MISQSSIISGEGVGEPHAENSLSTDSLPCSLLPRVPETPPLHRLLHSPFALHMIGLPGWQVITVIFFCSLAKMKTTFQRLIFVPAHFPDMRSTDMQVAEREREGEKSAQETQTLRVHPSFQE